MIKIIKEGLKVFFVLILDPVLFCISMFVFGTGNCISRIDFNGEIDWLIYIFTIASCLFFAFANVYIYKIVNKTVNLVSSIIQVVLLQIMIIYYEFDNQNLFITLKNCTNIFHYLMVFVMIGTIILQLVLCVKQYRSKRKIELDNL